MRVLLDDSIFTSQMEDNVLSDNLQDILKILGDVKVEVIKRTLSSKDLESYELEFDFIITENRDIHREANILNIGDKVLLIDEALQIFRSYLSIDSKIAPPALKNKLVRDLNYEDPILNTLKEEYAPEFERWFRKISKEGRKSWTYYRKDGSIGAILIYKFEDGPIDDSIPPLPKNKRLKIATLKVTHIGFKIGELFIKMAIDISIRNNIYEIYLTHFTKHPDRLVELISKYGFVKVAVKINGEDIYAKKLVVAPEAKKYLSPLEISKQFYPSFYDGESVKKFIVPILPEYHDKLFTDYPIRQTTLSEHDGEFVVEGNTINKAYLSHSNIKSIEPGDLILFYRSADIQSITSIGVVESMHIGIDEGEQILRLVGKRTVFSRNEINEWIKSNPVSVFLFRHHMHLPRPLELRELLDMGILKGAPQSVTEITQEKYMRIKEVAGIDERFTVS